MTSHSSTRRSFAVFADHNQYVVSYDPARQDPWPDTFHGLIAGEDRWLAVVTGSTGYVHVDYEVLHTRPAHLDPGWEMAAERDLQTGTGQIQIHDLFESSGVLVQARPGPGRARIRVHVTGRTASHDHPYPKPEEPIERHLIQLWPTDTEEPPTLLTPPDEFALHYR
jgi:hypothetical protein